MDAQSAAQEAVLNIRITFAERARKAIEEEMDAVDKLPSTPLRRALNGEL